ncbi:MAG: NUDIX domain-containing protein [Thaumarchaeota archaeon S14]|nr:MAG: NUDIX domain-containing protein [Thaumarchaeota archaeon S14]
MPGEDRGQRRDGRVVQENDRNVPRNGQKVGLRARNVATSFLRNGGQYLVLRRSDRVRTLRGMWSAVSGSIGEGERAMDRALAEILEETGIRSASLSLASSAPPAVVGAGLPCGPWRVHAFLFESSTRRVTLNWESSDHRWVSRGELASLDAVPRLAETLGSLLAGGPRP